MGKEKGKEKKPKPYSRIESHKRQKKTLVPPLMALPNVALRSWVDDRMPEMIWAALLIARLGRDRAHRQISRVRGHIYENSD